MSKKIADDVMSANCDAIAIFSIYRKFGAIRKPDSGRMVCKTYIFINSNLFPYKNWKKTKKSLTQLTLLLWVEVPFLPKIFFSIWCMRLHAHTPAHAPLVWYV